MPLNWEMVPQPGSEVHDVTGGDRVRSARRLHHQMPGVVDLDGHAHHGFGRQLDPHPLSERGAALA